MIKTGKGGYQIWYLGIDFSPDTLGGFTVPNPPSDAGKFVVMDGVSIVGVKQPSQVVDITTGTFDAYGVRWTYSSGSLSFQPIPELPGAATTTTSGLVYQAENVPNISSGSLATMTAEDDAVMINLILTALKTAGIMTPDGSPQQASVRKSKKDGDNK